MWKIEVTPAVGLGYKPEASSILSTMSAYQSSITSKLYSISYVV